MILKKLPHFHYRRPFKPLSTSTAPAFLVAEIARLQRENAELRETIADVRCLVIDINLRKLTMLSAIVTINGIRKLVTK